jgi:hypothetical protein
MYRSMEQIVQEYDGEWVCLVKCHRTPGGGILGGEVWDHSFPKKNWSEFELCSGYEGDDHPVVLRCIAHPERVTLSVSRFPIYISDRELLNESS